MEKSIYFDNAATTPLDTEVAQRMLPFFSECFGNADSPHAFGRKAMVAVDCARDVVAAALNAKPSEIYFTSGGTEADNWAILGGARAKRKEGKTHVLISAIEHHAALFAAETLEKEGFEVEYIPVNDGGRVELNTVQRLLRPSTALVCVMRVNNETGVIQPIEELAPIVKETGALFFVDGVQAAPHEKIDVKKWGVDLLSISSHKLHGPKGCGALYIRSGVKMERLVGGGEQERGMRGGTLNVPAIVGFSAAVEKTAQGLDTFHQAVEETRRAFLDGISALDGVQVNGDERYRLGAVLSLSVDGVDNATLLYRLDLDGLCVAAGSACASASVKPSHVLTAMGMTEERARQTVRISFGRQNTAAEGARAAEIFVNAVKSLRKN
jgi:cysteine desulfurase